MGVFSTTVDRRALVLRNTLRWLLRCELNKKSS